MSSLWDCNTNLYLDPDSIPSEFRLFFFASELMKKKMKCGMLYLICCTLYTCLLLLWLGDISFYKVPEVANWNIIFAQAVPPSVCRTTASQDSFLWSFGTQIFTLNLIAYYFFFNHFMFYCLFAKTMYGASFYHSQYNLICNYDLNPVVPWNKVWKLVLVL